MSVNNADLKNSIMSVVKDNDYTIDDLKGFLGPLRGYVNAPNFVGHLTTVVEEILKDRDGNNQFNLDDLKMLKDDILAITSLISAVLLVICSIPEFKLKYDAGATEELVFKTFAFIFLVVVPKETGRPWNEEDKEKVVDIVLSFYNLINSSQLTKDLIEKILKWFRSKGWCKCLDAPLNREDVIAERMPRVRAELGAAIQRNREALRVNRELVTLRAQLESLKN